MVKARRMTPNSTPKCCTQLCPRTLVSSWWAVAVGPRSASASLRFHFFWIDIILELDSNVQVKVNYKFWYANMLCLAGFQIILLHFKTSFNGIPNTFLWTCVFFHQFVSIISQDHAITLFCQGRSDCLKVRNDPNKYSVVLAIRHFIG